MVAGGSVGQIQAIQAREMSELALFWMELERVPIQVIFEFNMNQPPSSGGGKAEGHCQVTVESTGIHFITVNWMVLGEKAEGYCQATVFNKEILFCFCILIGMGYFIFHNRFIDLRRAAEGVHLFILQRRMGMEFNGDVAV